MEYVTTNIAYRIADEESQRVLSMVSSKRKKEDSLPDFNFLKTLYEHSSGIKAWVSLKTR